MASDHAGREERATMYRKLAVEAEEMAGKARSQEIREAYLTLADGWHKLARETSKVDSNSN